MKITLEDWKRLEARKGLAKGRAPKRPGVASAKPRKATKFVKPRWELNKDIAGGDTMDVTVALKIRSPNAKPENGFAKSKRVEREHGEVKLWLGLASRAVTGTWRPSRRSLVTMTRLGPGTMDDDNIVGGMKNVRDAVARWIGVNDYPSSPCLFVCAQERNAAHGVRIRIEEIKAPGFATEISFDQRSVNHAVDIESIASILLGADRRGQAILAERIRRR